MHASTRTLDVGAAADSCLARTRETQAKYGGAAATVTGVAPRLDPRRAADERAGPRSPSNRIPSGLARHVETTLFAVTLAAIGCLYLGALPAQVF